MDVRFIELMPIGAGKDLESVPNASVLAALEERYGRMAEDPDPRGSGPAVYRRPEGFAGRIGFISAMHGKFCGKCNRLRLTSTGDLACAMRIPSRCGKSCGEKPRTGKSGSGRKSGRRRR